MNTDGTPTTPSYADVLHRLSLGEEVLGDELLRLPGYDGEGIVVAPIEYAIDMVPGLLDTAAAFAAESYTVGPNCDPAGAVKVINRELFEKCPPPYTPTPKLIRELLWQIGVDADMTIRMKGLN